MCSDLKMKMLSNKINQTLCEPRDLKKVVHFTKGMLAT